MRYLTAAPKVTWVTDRSGTLVVHEDSDAVFQLTGLAEILWNCLVQGFSYARIIQITAEMRRTSLDAAEEAVQAVLREWRDLGIIVQKEEEHG